MQYFGSDIVLQPTQPQLKNYKTLLKAVSTESDTVYHAKRGEYTTSSSLKDYIKSPSMYFYKHLSGECEHVETEALYFGTLTHVVVLEGPHKARLEYSFYAPKNKEGDEYTFISKKFKEAQIVTLIEEKKKLARVVDLEKCMRMRDAVHSHEDANDLLRKGVAERVVRGSYQGRPVQIKIDYLTPYGIVDLKTVADIDKFHNGSKYNDLHKWGYLHSAAFYRTVLHQANPKIPKQSFYFIVVEKTAPFEVGVWKVSDHVLDEYEQLNYDALMNLKNSIETDQWMNPYAGVREIA